MQIDAYNKLVKAEPWLLSVLRFEIGPSIMAGGRDHPDMSRSEWIERYVDGIEIKPLHALGGLGAKSLGRETAECSVSFVIFHHYNGVDSPFHRLKYHRHDGETLHQTLTELRGQNRAFKPEQLVVDAIVRHTRTRDVRYYREKIEICPFLPDDSRRLLMGIPVPPLEIIDDATFMTDPEGY